MLEIIGVVFGGVTRLAQHWMETKDKQREREHEAVMFEKQIILQSQKIDAERDLRRMDYDALRDAGDIDLLKTAINDQMEQVKVAGGFIAKLSASVRPLVSYWLLAIYSASKAVTLYLTWQSGVSIGVAVMSAYTEFDGTLLGSIMSYWFADRSLRKTR